MIDAHVINKHITELHRKTGQQINLYWSDKGWLFADITLNSITIKLSPINPDFIEELANTNWFFAGTIAGTEYVNRFLMIKGVFSAKDITHARHMVSDFELFYRDHKTFAG